MRIKKTKVSEEDNAYVYKPFHLYQGLGGKQDEGWMDFEIYTLKMLLIILIKKLVRKHDALEMV